MKMYVKNNGKILGPLEWSKITLAYEKGRLGTDALVSDDRNQWISIEEAQTLIEKRARKNDNEIEQANNAPEQNTRMLQTSLPNAYDGSLQYGAYSPQPNAPVQNGAYPPPPNASVQNGAYPPQPNAFVQNGAYPPPPSAFVQNGVYPPQPPNAYNPGLPTGIVPYEQSKRFCPKCGVELVDSNQKNCWNCHYSLQQGNNTKIIAITVGCIVVCLGIIFMGWWWHENSSGSSSTSDSNIFTSTISVHITVTKWLAGTYDSWKFNCEYKLYADNECVATRNSTSMSVSFDVKVKKGAELRAEMLPKNGFGGIAETLEGPASWENKITASYSGQYIKIECK